MRAIVVYDSVFGNTEQIAQAIKAGLDAQAEAQLLKAQDVSAKSLVNTDLLVVGSPTRGFQPTEVVSGLLKGADPNALKDVKVAAFDTRLKADELKSSAARFIVKTGGYASKRIASQLEKAGGSLVAPPEGFYVEDREGPLKAGELERAAAWAKELLARL